MTKFGFKVLAGIVVWFIFILLITGCSTLEGVTGLTFDNRVACTVAGDKAVVVSEYGGRIGISSTISELDRPYICGAR